MNLNEHFNKAMVLKEEDKHKEAVIILLKLYKKFKITKNNIVIPLILGYCYRELENFKESKKYFKICTKLNPKHRLSSLGLYHCLRNMGNRTQAYRELDRYIKITGGQYYSDLILPTKSYPNFNSKPIYIDI